MSTENPWKEISLSDYEGHMSSDSVMQLQTLNDIMKEQLCAFPVKSVMILGAAGGNGLDNVDIAKYRTVYGVDINREYLREAEKRYSRLGSVLKLLCLDLTSESSLLPQAELIIADLLIEYIGCECFKDVIIRVKPKYVSCGIQINTDSGFVSETPFLHCFDGLADIHRDIFPDELTEQLGSIGYGKIGEKEYPLPNGKKILKADYKRSDK